MPVSTIDSTPALVVVDLQQGLLGAPTVPYPMEEVVRQTARLAKAFRAHDLPVALVTVEGGAPGRTEAGHPSGDRPAGWSDVAEGLDPQPGDIRITKHRWNAFHDTGLHAELTGRGVTQVIIAGVATSVGVEGTARGAHDHGYHVVLATDSMTDIDAAAHANSIERIFGKLGETGSVDEIIELIGRNR
ncbi:isochorismatase family protein [Amycolatopsis pithecellobii]|uniref:Isochorismatase family protein n=1 Tax=Amycolatopsis pithecellobii TaxID=664692 RepID=A0A6N7Z038_9PSEU|nr:isochorismatase family protein [Amycolatopsis pithecellobii]MTD53111.1 isochorismatase family protein [Amycolatopsis pithecellobii]